MTSWRPANLTRGTLSGVSWVYTGTATGALMQVAYTAVMGRLLTPADFGLLAMALVFQRFGTYLAQMGVGQALIQKADVSRDDVRVGFTTSLLLGAVFALAVAVAAPLAGLLFATAAVVPLVRVLALSFLFVSCGLVATNLLRRQLRFRALALIHAGTYAVAFLGVGIGMAAAGYGVWSLVGAQLCQSLLQSALAYSMQRHPVTPLLAWSRVRALYGYGARVSFVGFLEFVGANLDMFLIGRYAGHQPLGHYHRAYYLVNLPFHQIVTGLSRVLFPAFSRIQADSQRLRGAYRSALGIVAAFIVPAAVGLAIAAPEVVRVVLGPQWGLAATVLPLLAVAAAFSFLSQLAGVVCDATASLNRKMALQSVHIIVLAGLLLAAVEFDEIAGYALAVLVAELLRHVLYMKLMGQVLGFGIREHVAVYGPVLAAGMIVACSLGVVTWPLRAMAPSGVVFTGQTIAGAIALAACLSWGPLAHTRRDVRDRFAAAGVLDKGRFGRMVRSGLDFGR